MTNDDNFGPWIDWAGGECPIPDAKAGDYEIEFRDGDVRDNGGAIFYNWSQKFGDFSIRRYRVRLPADDLLRQAIEALRDRRDFIIGLGQSPEAEGWPRDPYAVVMKVEAVLAAAAERGL